MNTNGTNDTNTAALPIASAAVFVSFVPFVSFGSSMQAVARELKLSSTLDAQSGGFVDMGKRRDPQSLHAEGQHGPRTHARFVEQLHEGPAAEPTEEIVQRKRTRAAREGKRRLVEDRQQHDEGEKNSERTRFAKDHQHGKTGDGPSDNTGNLHGVTGSRSHRADYKTRGPDGLPRKKRSD